MPSPPLISIHAPLAGRDYRLSDPTGRPEISIHAPLAGRDAALWRGAAIGGISIHAPLAGRDLTYHGAPKRGKISIHAPLAGRDNVTYQNSYIFIAFQSTRPLRGATRRPDDGLGVPSISIHAPLAGRDLMVAKTLTSLRHFNPRAPCGARPFLCAPPYISCYFNPRAPCGARLSTDANFFLDARFQSTRPLRGATYNGL